MTLSKFSDYAFRVLIYLAKHEKEMTTVEQLSTELDISEHHLKKIIQRLAKTEFITSTKGRSGGIQLGNEPQNINLGAVLRVTEDNLILVECFSEQKNTCPYNGACKLKNIMNEALVAFINQFDQYSLQDIL